MIILVWGTQFIEKSLGHRMEPIRIAKLIP